MTVVVTNIFLVSLFSLPTEPVIEVSENEIYQYCYFCDRKNQHVRYDTIQVLEIKNEYIKFKFLSGLWKDSVKYLEKKYFVKNIMVCGNCCIFENK